MSEEPFLSLDVPDDFTYPEPEQEPQPVLEIDDPIAQFAAESDSEPTEPSPPEAPDDSTAGVVSGPTDDERRRLADVSLAVREKDLEDEMVRVAKLRAELAQREVALDDREQALRLAERSRVGGGGGIGGGGGGGFGSGVDSSGRARAPSRPNWPRCCPCIELDYSRVVGAGFKKAVLWIDYFGVFAFCGMLVYNFLCALFVVAVDRNLGFLDIVPTPRAVRYIVLAVLIAVIGIPSRLVQYYVMYTAFLEYAGRFHLIVLCSMFLPLVLSVFGAIGLADLGCTGWTVTLALKKFPFPFYPMLVAAIAWAVWIVYFLLMILFLIVIYSQDGGGRRAMARFAAPPPIVGDESVFEKESEKTGLLSGQ